MKIGMMIVEQNCRKVIVLGKNRASGYSLFRTQSLSRHKMFHHFKTAEKDISPSSAFPAEGTS